MTSYIARPAIGAVALLAGPAVEIAQAAMRAFNAVSATRRRWSGMRELQALDDRMLADVGIARSQIEIAASRGRRGLVSGWPRV
jgi:uncharacterized protein YjiS (DUF1127 family)